MVLRVRVLPAQYAPADREAPRGHTRTLSGARFLLSRLHLVVDASDINPMLSGTARIASDFSDHFLAEGPRLVVGHSR
jgi:hypothetical protein